MLDKLIKLSSISGVFLIFCGVLKLIIYYSNFDINIVDYLSFSEIITSFLDDINILLIYGATMLTITYMALNFLHRKTKVSIDAFFDAIIKFIFPHRYKYVIFFLVIIVVLLALLYSSLIRFNYFIIYLLVFSTLQLMTFMLMIKDDEGEIDIPDSSKGITIAITITFAIFLLAKHDIQVVTDNNATVEITTYNEIYECNKTTGNLYIGKTDGYIFIKLSKCNSTVSIPISKVEKFEFK